ncbi:MAG: STAS domain-containing protein [Deltaproteobacteria bacterium]|nr:STAS domain-containing protein [Deltaproteobacteria bacterium]
MAMEMQVERMGDVAVLRCHGSLDADTVPEFRHAIRGLCEQGVCRFVLDGAALQFVDSMGLGVLISLMRRVRPQEGEVKIAALTDDVRSIFEITRLHRVFDICSTSQEACQKFRRR